MYGSAMTRIDPPLAADERTMLAAFLDYHRATLLDKVDGLDRWQMAQATSASTLTLGGLVKHMALVEDSWFNDRFLGRDSLEPWASVSWDDDPDWEFHSAIRDQPEELIALYGAACDRSRIAFDQAVSLDVESVEPDRSGAAFTLRWIMLHMIEETARHNGHADLLRESIDGATGE
jgi:uncharacterized damage-inducible protein DinB